MSDFLSKPFKHFDTYANFLTKKISADSSNTTYRINNGALQTGTPEILWENFVLIHDIGQIWNRGRFYNHQSSSISKMAKNAFEGYDGAIISFLEEDGRSYFLSGGIFDAFKSAGVIPSLSISPQCIDNRQGENYFDGTIYPVMSIDDLYYLLSNGCDVINHSYSNNIDSWNGDASYEDIVSDLKQAEQWFTSHGIFTNCFSYPFGFNVKSQNMVNAVNRFEEYALAFGTGYEHDQYIKGFQDRIIYNQIWLSDSNIDDVKEVIDYAITNKLWIVITTHSCGDASVDDLGSASYYGKLSPSTITSIIQYINRNTGLFRYYSVTDALKVRAPELNINGFSIYKDGDIELTDKARDTIMSKAVFNSTTDANWKTPMLSYVQSNIDFDALSSDFKLKMLQYVISNWNKETGEYSILADK